jgi:hypothetical protein
MAIPPNGAYQDCRLDDRAVFFAKWAREFEEWAEQCFRISIAPVLCDGIEHPVAPGVTYSLQLRDTHPWGYVQGVGPLCLREIWRPSCLANGRIDPRQLLAARGGPYLERDVWDFCKQKTERYFHGMRLEEQAVIIPATIVTLRPTRLQSPRNDYELAELETELNTSFGKVSVSIPIPRQPFVPPGCGMLEGGARIALRLQRCSQDNAQLVAMLARKAIADLRT